MAFKKFEIYSIILLIIPAIKNINHYIIDLFNKLVAGTAFDQFSGPYERYTVFLPLIEEPLALLEILFSDGLDIHILASLLALPEVGIVVCSLIFISSYGHLMLVLLLDIFLLRFFRHFM